MEIFQTAPVADADNRAIRHPLSYEPIDGVLHTLVERGSGLIEKCHGRARNQNAAEGKALLLAR